MACPIPRLIPANKTQRNQTARPGLADLPPELLVDIAQRLDLCADVNSLLQVNRKIHDVLQDEIYRIDVSHDVPVALLMGCVNANLTVIQKSITAGMSVTACIPLDDVDLIADTYSINDPEATKMAIEASPVCITPLTMAIIARQIEVVQYLLDRGAAEHLPDIQDEPASDMHPHQIYQRPLSVAVRVGDAQLFRLLLKHSTFGLNIQDANGRVPLHHSASTSAEITEMLLQTPGIKTQFRNEDGITPLEIAFSLDGVPTLPVFLAHKDKFGPSRIQNAFVDFLCCQPYSKVQCKMAKIVLDQCQISMQAKHDALETACRHRNARLLKILLASGVDTSFHRQQHEQGFNILQNALLYEACNVHNQDLEVIRALLDHGFDINEQVEGDYTPLHRALVSGRKELVDFLIDCGADTNFVSPTGATIAHCLAKREFESPSLVDKDIHSKTDETLRSTCNKHSALHDACVSEKLYTARKLIEFGDDIDERLSNGYTLINMLIAAQTSRVQTPDMAFITLLLENGAAVEVGPNGFSPLHAFCMLDEDVLMMKFISHGLDMEHRHAETKFTPLQLACKQHSEKCILALLDHGASTNSWHPEGMDHSVPYYVRSYKKGLLGQPRTASQDAMDDLFKRMLANIDDNSMDVQKPPRQYVENRGPNGQRGSYLAMQRRIYAGLEKSDVDGS